MSGSARTPRSRPPRHAAASARAPRSSRARPARSRGCSGPSRPPPLPASAPQHHPQRAPPGPLQPSAVRHRGDRSGDRGPVGPGGRGDRPGAVHRPGRCARHRRRRSVPGHRGWDPVSSPREAARAGKTSRWLIPRRRAVFWGCGWSSRPRTQAEGLAGGKAKVASCPRGEDAGRRRPGVPASLCPLGCGAWPWNQSSRRRRLSRGRWIEAREVGVDPTGRSRHSRGTIRSGRG